ncbi:5360_t:CDS:2 [Funneliformis geosporum]|uniref:15506_t:CDS:1 n=1 Tax=Funneliformis geosporum TaxID=1117311 RepID=A0A9W4SKH0_9GLOM|nr:15506_t:CDS:2 [Funneliformis geosporum]CAI2174568.1 5360_t:CDS:2 [Funneliformis geosporum]
MTSEDDSHEKSQFIPTKFKWQQWGDHVCIAGSFDPPTPSWTPIEMPKNSNDVHEVVLDLLPNKKYCYKFVIDGSWVLDPSLPKISDEHNNENHEICVDPVSDEKSTEKPVEEENNENGENPQLVPQIVEDQTEMNQDDEVVVELNVLEENDQFFNESLDQRAQMNQNDEEVGELNVPEENDQFFNESLDQRAQTEKSFTQAPEIGEPSSTASIIDNDSTKGTILEPDVKLSAENVAIENPNEFQSKESHESDGTSQIITEPIKVLIKPVENVEDIDKKSIFLDQERKGGADDEISSNIPPQGTVQIEDPKNSATSEKTDTTVVDPSELEIFNNFSWAKDDLSDDDVTSSWLEPPVPDYIEPPSEWTVGKNDSVVWAEDSPDSSIQLPNIVEVYANKEQLSSTWSDETTTEQIKHSNEALLNEIPSSTNINDSLETLLDKNDEEPPVKTTLVAEEKKEKNKVLKFKENVVESDQGVIIKNKLVIKETITCPPFKVKEKVDEPSLVDTAYLEPESSATAFMKIPSMSTVVAAPVIVDNTISQDYQGQDIEKGTQSISNAPAGKISQRKIISFSPNASPGESTRNADTCIQNIATLSSREIVSTPTKETTTIKSKVKKPKEMLTSRPKDQVLAVQRNDIVDSGGGLIILVTSLATTFTLGIISMLYKAVFGKAKNK